MRSCKLAVRHQQQPYVFITRSFLFSLFPLFLLITRGFRVTMAIAAAYNASNVRYVWASNGAVILEPNVGKLNQFEMSINYTAMYSEHDGQGKDKIDLVSCRSIMRDARAPRLRRYHNSPLDARSRVNKFTAFI